MARQPEHLLQYGTRKETECTNRSAGHRQGGDDRAIILLWLESMRYDEIAAIVGLTPAAVTSRLFRIKEQLKSMSH